MKYFYCNEKLTRSYTCIRKKNIYPKGRISGWNQDWCEEEKETRK